MRFIVEINSMRLILILSLSILVSCQKSEDKPSGSAIDPVYGRWIYKYESSISSAKSIIAELNSDGSLMTFNSYVDISSSNNSAKIYYRLNKGTFTRRNFRKLWIG